MAEDPTREPGKAPPEPPIADPAPLGLAGFALTTFVLSVVNAGFVGESVLKTFVPLAFFYGGLAQLLAGMFEFRNRNMFGVTAFTSYGAFWIALGFFVFFQEQLGITEENLPIALGLTLLGWAIFTFIMWLGSFGVSAAIGVVFTLLLATFVLLAIGYLSGAMFLIPVGGYVGIATAAAAWYAAAAEVLNDTYGRTILPLGERG